MKVKECNKRINKWVNRWVILLTVDDDDVICLPVVVNIWQLSNQRFTTTGHFHTWETLCADINQPPEWDQTPQTEIRRPQADRRPSRHWAGSFPSIVCRLLPGLKTGNMPHMHAQWLLLIHQIMKTRQPLCENLKYKTAGFCTSNESHLCWQTHQCTSNTNALQSLHI